MKTILRIVATSVLFLASCTQTRLEQSLALAGDNRAELEKVLAHYSQDPADELKLRAAEFLIENMPWHYSYGGAYYEDYVRKVDSMHHDLPIELRMVAYTFPEKEPSTASRLEIRPDIENVTADFLIDNIEHSFDLWTKNPWLKGLSFENFCEYLLPYRMSHEPLMNWKDSLPDNFRVIIDTIRDKLPEASRDTYMFYQFLDEHIMADVPDYFLYQIEAPDPELGIILLNCMESSLAYARLWRICGIPTAIDFLPLWGNEIYNHADIAIIDEHAAAGFIPKTPHFKAGNKVFRTAFSANISKRLREIPDYLPYTLRNPFFRDVTADYFSTTDVKVDLRGARDNPSFACLGVFGLSWEAVSFAKIRGGRATFDNMAVEYVYIPFYYKDGRQVFISNPFHLDVESRRRYFDPDKNNLQTITLDRKDRINDYKVWWGQVMVDARIETSNDSNFGPDKTQILFTQKENTYWRTVTVPVDSPTPSRYYRLINSGLPIDLAEIHFYDRAGDEITGTLICDEVSMANPDLPKVLDSDLLTWAMIESWVGVDFGRPVNISRIEYVPRNDKNGIYPGMQYELFYFDTDGWVSMGVKTSTGDSITYDGVPEGALLWLRNHTEGKEERIFTYENGRQVWW